MNTHPSPTADELHTLVNRLDPRRADAPRQEWVKIGMAIHGADSSDIGYRLWEDFSQQSPKFNAKDCRAAWKSFKPGAVSVATLIKYANDDDPGGKPVRSQEAPMDTKRDYAGLDDYATAHGVPADVLRAAGWAETTHDRRPALAFMTARGTRWRFLDGEKPSYDSPRGYTRCWYRLEEALTIAAQTGDPLVLCNGEASAVAAQHHGIAAIAVAGGSEKPTLPDDLLAEIIQHYHGPILVALDCDLTGRSAAPQLAAQLRAAGLVARAVDLQGNDGFDVADFCRLNNGTSAAAVQSLPDLAPATTAAPTASAPVAVPRFTVAIEDELFNLPALRYLDRDLLLCAGAFHLIYGASGSGKTFYAIERAMRQASLGRRVLYIPTEDVSGLRYRVAAWRRAHPEASGRMTWLQMPEGLDLQDHKQVAELIEAIEPFQYDHIVLDTLREAHSGDENSSQDTARINRAIQRLVATGAAVDVVHHTGVAGERPRGSTALFGNCDVVIKVESDDGLIRASFDKIRNGTPRDSLAFGLALQDTGLIDGDGEPVVSAILRPAAQFTRRDAPMNANQRKVLSTLSLSIFSETGAKNNQLKAAAELPERTLYNALSWLKNKGYISQGTKGDPYYITPAGLAQLGSEYTAASEESAAGSPTASTASPLPPTARQDVPLSSATAATATTLRGGSGGSAVAGDQSTVADPYRVCEWDEDPPRYTVTEWTDDGAVDLPGDHPTLEAARAAMPDPAFRACRGLSHDPNAAAAIARLMKARKVETGA
jgi:AAA domain/Primase C terminal 2 (PriCT-2)